MDPAAAQAVAAAAAMVLVADTGPVAAMVPAVDTDQVVVTGPAAGTDHRADMVRRVGTVRRVDMLARSADLAQRFTITFTQNLPTDMPTMDLRAVPREGRPAPITEVALAVRAADIQLGTPVPRADLPEALRAVPTFTVDRRADRLVATVLFIMVAALAAAYSMDPMTGAGPRVTKDPLSFPAILCPKILKCPAKRLQPKWYSPTKFI
jgi:hypothetical protein